MIEKNLQISMTEEYEQWTSIWECFSEKAQSYEGTLCNKKAIKRHDIKSSNIDALHVID